MVKYGKNALYNPRQVFILSDVQGEADKLLELINKILPQVNPQDHIVFVGDLLNRGPKNPQVLETIKMLKDRLPQQVFIIQGNHDWMFIQYITGKEKIWMETEAQKALKLGKIPTLIQMKEHWNLPDTEPLTIQQALIDKDLINIFGEMIPYYETEKLLVTHAPLSRQPCIYHGLLEYEEDQKDPDWALYRTYFLERIHSELRWEFSDESDKIKEFKKYRVAGHQHQFGYKKPRLFSNRAFIDTGAGGIVGGRITCLIFPRKQWLQSSS